MSLQAAQARLMALRAKHQQQKKARVTHIEPPTAVRQNNATLTDLPKTLPAHLGWHSAALTQHLQKRSDAQPTEISPNELDNDLADDIVLPSHIRTELLAHTSNSKQPITPPPTIRLYPSLAMAWLKQGLTAPARVWLLLRHLDKQGCGWLGLTAVRQHLTNPDSPFCLCGARQLRNLLRDGEGIFWVREGERVWLRGVKKVSAKSEVRRLQGQAIQLPVFSLTKSLKETKAHFYAGFHSGRNGRPIARDTLTRLSGASANSQRRYEQLLGVKKQTNYAIGQRATSEQIKATAWERGHAMFLLNDSQGKHGKPNTTYTAWQLPNSYTGIHALACKGNQKRINGYLNDLSYKGMTGNAEEAITRRFYDGKTAAKLYNRGHETELYWCGSETAVWYHLPPAR